MVIDIILITIPQTESEIESIRRFLFDMIRREFGYGYIPDYHRDIMEFRKHYLNPPGNTFISASLGGKVIGTLGLRAYDREFEGLSYDPETTAGLWRVFVHEDYRRRGIASLLVGIAEAHAARMGYRRMYLHTHKHVRGALEFWLSMGYRVTLDTGNELNTVHMEKPLKPVGSPDKLSTIHMQKPFKTHRVLQY